MLSLIVAIRFKDVIANISGIELAENITKTKEGMNIKVKKNTAIVFQTPNSFSFKGENLYKKLHLYIAKNDTTISINGNLGNTKPNEFSLISVENCNTFSYTNIKKNVIPIGLFRNSCLFHFDPEAKIIIGNETFKHFINYNGTETKALLKSEVDYEKVFEKIDNNLVVSLEYRNTYSLTLLIIAVTSYSIGLILFIIYQFCFLTKVKESEATCDASDSNAENDDDSNAEHDDDSSSENDFDVLT